MSEVQRAWGGPDALQEVAATPAELAALSRRLRVNLAGAVVLAVAAGARLWSPELERTSTLLAACAGLLVGVPVLLQGLCGFLARPPRDFTDQLVALAILASLVTGDFVTAALVPLFLELGHLLEERSVRGAQAALDGLTALRSPVACRLGALDREEQVPVEQLRVGDRVRVRPGEPLPVDGRVVVGHASIDPSAVTGESVYEEKAPGDQVFTGMINLDGVLVVEVLAVGEASLLGRMLAILRVVEASQSPALRLLERYAAVYLPLVLALAGWTLVLSGETSRAIAVLIVACPCSLVLAGPAAILAAMAVSTRQKILVKSARFLEQMAEVDTLVLDKTGTVTGGQPVVQVIRGGEGWTEGELATWAGPVVRASPHPVARALAAWAGPGPVVEELREVPGRGTAGQVGGRTVRVGRLAWLRTEGVEGDLEIDHPGPGAYVALDRALIGYVGLLDPPRPEAAAALARLRELGLTRMVLLTGDREPIARSVAAGLGLDAVVAEVLPEQKLEAIRAEQAAGRRVLMVGDGVNDTLALSQADVGVAFGARVSEITLGGSDVAVLGNDLRLLPRMVDLAALTRRTIDQNVAIGLVFSVGMLALASAGWIGPLPGALLHNLGALLVVANGARLLRRAGGSGVVSTPGGD